MGRPINVLFVEDVPDDALLIVAELRDKGFLPDYQIVDTPGAMYDALIARHFDLVIADHNLPEFSSRRAWRLLHDHGSDIPFIIVSGNLPEAEGGEEMLAGAHDFIPKGNLSRLVPAILREMKEASLRRSMQPGRAPGDRREIDAFASQSLELAKLAGRLLSGTATAEVLESVFVVTMHATEATACGLFIVDPQVGFIFHAGNGWSQSLPGACVSERGSASEFEFALKTGKTLIFDDLDNEYRFNASPFLHYLNKFQSGVIVPPPSDGRAFFAVADSRQRLFHKNQLDFIEAAAALAPAMARL